MRKRALPFGLLFLVAVPVLACSAGDESAPAAAKAAPPTAKEALAKLVEYRGKGAIAARRTIEWVDAIVAGGPAMLPALDRELEKAEDWRYSFGGMDYPKSGEVVAKAHGGVVTRFLSLRGALLEAVGRIGGKEAATILMREAQKATDAQEPWLDRIVATIYLVPLADTDDRVPEFMNRHLVDYLLARDHSKDLYKELSLLRPWLTPETFEPMATVFRSAWIDPQSQDEIGCALASLDRERAGKMFLGLLGSDQTIDHARAGAARALGRMPGWREPALQTALASSNPAWLGWFLRGLALGRYGEIERETAARESLDPVVMLAYVKDREKGLRQSLDILATVSEALDERLEGALRLEEWRKNFKDTLDQALIRQQQLEAAIEARRSKR